MRRKSMLPGAILTLLTLICLLIPARVTWAVRERALGVLSPVLKLFGSDAHAATSDGELPKAVQAKIAQLQVQHENDQRVLASLRGPTVAGASPESAAQPPVAVSGGPMGRFLARPIWNGRALYTVDVGSDHGVEIGDGVVAQGGGAGLVLALSATTATFGPLTHPDLSVQAMVARTRAVGLLTGTGRGLELRYLQAAAMAPGEPLDPQASTAKDNREPAPGDLIVATGRDGLFPEGTPLGWVESIAVEGKNNGGLLRVTVKPWCDPNAADAVLIVPRRPEPIPLPEDPRLLRKQWETLQAAQAAQAAVATGNGPAAAGAQGGRP